MINRKKGIKSVNPVNPLARIQELSYAPPAGGLVALGVNSTGKHINVLKVFSRAGNIVVGRLGRSNAGIVQ